MLLKMKLT